MPRKKETLTLSVPPGTKEKLDAIAQRLGYKWGDRPSPSGLVSAIAQGDVAVGDVFALDTNQIKALRQAVKDLVDTGHIEEAKSVITLLLSRGQLEAPIRQALMKQVSQPIEGWRIQIDQYIQQQQPFHLVYQNSQQQVLEYTVRYAEPIFYEKRFYLQIWCEETEDSQDIPALKHNRCFRFERIQAIFPIAGAWRGQLDSINVELHFRGWLANAYEEKLDDVTVEPVADSRTKVLRVIRRVVNPFWLFREIRRYGADCEIISPQDVRDRFAQDVRALYENYFSQTAND